MATVTEKSASVWHAFASLKDPESGLVRKAQLKVLTHNIANSLGLQNIEKKIDSYEENLLSFPSYVAFLKSEIQGHVQRGTAEALSYLDKVDDVCWYICCNNYGQRTGALSDDYLFSLWKLFNILAEMDSNGICVTPAVVDCEEIHILAQQFCAITGRTFDVEHFQEVSEAIPQFSFEQTMEYFQSHLCKDVEKRVVLDAFRLLQDEIIYEVIQKGLLVKKGHLITNWKERWFVLTPNLLRYYGNATETDMKGEIAVGPQCRVEVLPDTKGVRPYRFKYTSPLKSFEMSTPDMRTCNEWITSIRKAVEFSQKIQTPQQIARQKRRKKRDEKRRLREEEELRQRQEQEAHNKTRQELEQQRLGREAAEAKAQEVEDWRKEEEQNRDETRQELGRIRLAGEVCNDRLRQEEERSRLEKERAEKTEEELLNEKQARTEAEARLIEEASRREEERIQMMMLERLNEELRQLLDDEKQAKRDEEIVRGLQAKLLAEEFEKREKLEQLQEQLQGLLQDEQQKREGLEGTIQAHEEVFQQEKAKLQQLETERLTLDSKLQEATVKLEEAEKQRFRIKQQQMPVFQKIQELNLPDPGKFDIVTHRGVGAFCEGDFNRSLSYEPQSPLATEPGDSGVTSESSETTESEVDGFKESEGLEALERLENSEEYEAHNNNSKDITEET